MRLNGFTAAALLIAGCTLYGARPCTDRGWRSCRRRETALIEDLDLRESGANRPLRSALSGLRLHFAFAPDLDEAAFSIQGSPENGYTIRAAGPTGWQYGASELIERGGGVFVHPEQSWVPSSFCLSCIGHVDELVSPAYRVRGTHIHTLHPIEYESTLLGTGALAELRFRRLVAWLIARRQNYLEWNLLRTVDASQWIAHASRLVEIAHAHGLMIGIVAPVAFRQQNSWYLVDGSDPRTASQQIRNGLDWLMQAGWDYVNVEMGASEFFPVPATEQVAWLDEVARHLDETWHVRTATKVHATINQRADAYGGINFN